jgi:uncharacterized protein YbjT (DUF2867 family)
MIDTSMKKVLLAGITGYLGSHIAMELHKRGYPIRAIARNPGKLKRLNINVHDVLEAEVTRPDTIEGCCDDIDTVISTVGITRQKDGLTYMDVDFQANLNLLRQAEKSNVKKFIYVSVLNGDKLKHLKICEAKERFVEQLMNSGMDYCVIRPNGFFSDIAEFHAMAQKGRIYLFGDGELTTNPIHGEDLAVVCADAIERADRVIEAGGPKIMTHNQIAKAAFNAVGREPKITHIPDWIRAATLTGARTFTSSKTYGPIEFFLTVMAMDMIAPEYGKLTLEEFFAQLSQRNV